MAVTPNTGAPLVEQSQSAKEVVLNDAILILDDILDDGILFGTLAARPAPDWKGRLYFRTDAPRTLYRDDGANWLDVLNEGGGGGGLADHGHNFPAGDGGQLTRPVINQSAQLIALGAKPGVAPPAGYRLLYVKTDDNLYLELPDGTERQIGGGGGGPVAAVNVSYAPFAGVISTNVQAVIQEVYAASARTAHTHNATEIGFPPGGTLAGANVDAALRELDTEKAATNLSFVTTVAEAGLTSEVVLGAGVHMIGTLAGRPGAGAVAVGAYYTATDDNGGTTYRSNGTGWVPIAAAVNASSAGSGHTIQEEGVSVAQRAGLNFIGPQVTVTDNSAQDRSEVTIAAAPPNAEYIVAAVDPNLTAERLLGTEIIMAGTLAARPAPGVAVVGALYLATDDQSGTLYRNNGTAWVAAAKGVGAPQGQTIQDEGTALAMRAALNFSGAGVTASDDFGNNRTNITIPGGAPTTAEYIVAASDAVLSAERVLATDVHMVGTLAARPGAGTVVLGAYYTATDDNGGTTYRSNGAAWVPIAGPVTPPTGTSGHTIQDEGVALAQRTGMNFTGTGVVATDNSAQNRTDITINTGAPLGGPYITTQADATLTAETVLGTGVIMAGTLAARPAPGAAPIGAIYLATDDNGGTSYRNTGAAWQAMGPGVSQVTGAPVGASYVTLAADATLTNEAVLGTTVIQAGTLAARPGAASVAAGTVYLATDDNGGTSYRSNGTAWIAMGAGVSGAGGAVWQRTGTTLKPVTAGDSVDGNRADGLTAPIGWPGSNFAEFTGRVRVRNALAVNDPLLQVGDTTTALQANSLWVQNPYTQWLLGVVGSAAGGQFITSSLQGDAVMMVTGGRLWVSKNASTNYLLIDNGIVHVLDRLKVGSGNALVTGWYTAAFTWVSPPAIPAMGAQEIDFTVTGAALGDLALASANITLPDGIEMAPAIVQTANVVRIVFHNWTGAAVTLPTFSLRASVWKMQ